MKIETIHESLVNGQREQMVRQIDEWGDTFWEDYSFLLEGFWSMIPGRKHEFFKDAVISYFRIKRK